MAGLTSQVTVKIQQITDNVKPGHCGGTVGHCDVTLEYSFVQIWCYEDICGHCDDTIGHCYIIKGYCDDTFWHRVDTD